MTVATQSTAMPTAEQHGFRPHSDGAFVPGFSGGDGDVKPGRTRTYRLTAAPSSVGVWPYHDHSPSMHESIEGGMWGMLSIRGRREPRESEYSRPDNGRERSDGRGTHHVDHSTAKPRIAAGRDPASRRGPAPRGPVDPRLVHQG